MTNRVRTSLLLATLALAATPLASAAQDRIASPRGEASTHFGGEYVDGRYQGGSWIVVDYGRPILRGRSLFGSGSEYGDGLVGNAPLWRVGANKSTRFHTEVDLMFGNQALPAGEYSVFAELAPSEWTLIFSNWGAKDNPQVNDSDAIWGAYGYTPDRDVIRVPMSVSTTAMSIDQLTIAFMNMTRDGGDFAIHWGDQMARASFTSAR